jgi:hypothetical protein
MKKRKRMMLYKTQSAGGSTATITRSPVSGRSRQDHHVLALQKTVGNRATQRQLQRDPEGAIQRAPEFGLDLTANRGEFANAANDYISSDTHKTEPVPLLLHHLGQKAGDMLSIYGMPRPQVWGAIDATSAVEGQFTKEDWKLYLSPHITGDPTQSLETLTADQVKHIVSVVYHEARHAEQYFKIAQFLADKGATADEIATKMNIHGDAAAAAFANPINLPVTKIPLLNLHIPQTGEDMVNYITIYFWYNQLFGAYKDYTKAVYSLVTDRMMMAFHTKALLADDTAETRDAMNTIMDTWGNTHKPAFEATRDNIDNSFFQFEYETRIRQHAETLLGHVTNAVDNWNRDQSLEAMRNFIATYIFPIGGDIKAAYEEILIEKDAHQVGDKAATSI